MLTTVVLVAISFTIQRHYNIINCIPYALLYIAITCLFCNWKFVPLTPLHCFTHLKSPTPLATTDLFSVFMSLFLFCFVSSFVLLDSTSK